jgi:AraC family transcriptional regulator of adaptative response / DNA-3-methyladenine glycosylase II
MLNADACYEALLTHDRRFDGKFFVGVTTTRIYCRPVCPARTPRRERCRFYETAAEAEREGFLPCLRCRPELAPGVSSVDAKARIAARAARVIENNWQIGIEDLARKLGVTSRHLRRALRDELGVTPLQLKQSRRIAVAKRLLRDTRKPLIEVAFASGFSSLRRFNAAFRQAVGFAPSALRKEQA